MHVHMHTVYMRFSPEVWSVVWFNLLGCQAALQVVQKTVEVQLLGSFAWYDWTVVVQASKGNKQDLIDKVPWDAIDSLWMQKPLSQVPEIVYKGTAIARSVDHSFVHPPCYLSTAVLEHGLCYCQWMPVYFAKLVQSSGQFTAGSTMSHPFVNSWCFRFLPQCMVFTGFRCPFLDASISASTSNQNYYNDWFLCSIGSKRLV